MFESAKQVLCLGTSCNRSVVQLVRPVTATYSLLCHSLILSSCGCVVIKMNKKSKKVGVVDRPRANKTTVFFT